MSRIIVIIPIISVYSFLVAVVYGERPPVAAPDDVGVVGSVPDGGGGGGGGGGDTIVGSLDGVILILGIGSGVGFGDIVGVIVDVGATV